jgi:hypothetical protein
VTYYDESQGDADKNKYVYNRVGDFPIVQLRKTEIKRNLVRSSSVRIAPPSKTVFNRDIRAAIIRSNSMQIGTSVPKIQPTKMRAKDDSHQIITNHEPLPIDDIAPSAKSVLDALEKNCRKRINNEELTMDRTKRQCATETVDGPNTREFIPIASQSAKRGRDQTSPNQKSESPNSQLRKKLRTRNNALFSSLSSSNFVLRPYAEVSIPETHETSKTIDEVERTEKRLRETSVSVPLEVEKPKAPLEKRLHLFNTRTDKIPTIFRSRATSDDDDDEEFKVNFVKPRAKPVNYDDTEEIQNVEKEKLSVMLSGLSDGFKSPVRDSAKDSVDSATLPAIPAPASISFTTSTTKSTVSPITTPASSSSITTSSPSLIALVKATELPEVAKTIQFGVSTATTTPSSTAVTKSGRVSPLAVFTTPGAEKPTTLPSIDANKSLITFTPVAKPASVPSVVTTTAAPSFTTSGAPSAFNFGSGNKEATAPKVGFSFGSTTSTAAPVVSTTSSAVATSPPSFNFQAPSTTAFSFGAKPTISVAPTGASTGIAGMTAAPITGLPSLSSSSTNLASTVSFMSKPATTTASGVGFSFGGSAAPSLTPSVNPLASTTTASVGFSFGSSQNASAVTTTSGGFSFGAQSASAFGTPAATSAPSFGGTAAAPSFGASSAFGQPAVTSPPSFGSTTPSFGQASSVTPSFGAAASAIPSFGAVATTSAPGFGASASATPSFGAPATATPSFGAPATTSAPGFGFSQSTPAPTPTGGMFSFGQKSAAPQVAPVTTNSSFSFGGAAPAVTSPTSAFSFGQQQQAAPTTTASASIFGRLGDKQAEAKPAFSFGGNNQPQAQSPPSMFGNNSAPSAPMFGSSTFGQNNNNAQPAPSANMFGNNSTPASNDFGSISKPASNGMFSFGGGSNTAQPATAPAQSNGMFSFGSNTNTPNPAQSSSGVFGGGNSSGQNVSASFTFKPSTGTVSSNPSPNVFGQSQPAAAPPSYQFGGQTTANASFTFGGASATPQVPSQQSAGFNFSGPQSAPAAGAFNFQGAQPSLPPQPTAGGLFNIGTGGNQQQQRRPIRQAMRRMK